MLVLLSYRRVPDRAQQEESSKQQQNTEDSHDHGEGGLAGAAAAKGIRRPSPAPVGDSTVTGALSQMTRLMRRIELNPNLSIAWPDMRLDRGEIAKSIGRHGSGLEPNDVI